MQDNTEGLEKLKSKREYSSDKNGWVRFKGSVKKVKLRAHIGNLAGKLARFKEHSRADYRKLLIASYEAYGLEGIAATYISELRSINEKLKEAKAKVEEERANLDNKENE